MQPVRFGTTVEFDPDGCDRCPVRAQCTTAALGHGRSVAIGKNERLQVRLNPGQRQKLDEMAQSRGTSASAVLRHLINGRYEEHVRATRLEAVRLLAAMSI